MGFLSDLKLKREKKKLEGLLQTAPTAEVFLRLSQLAAEEEDDLQRAVELASEGIRKFPGDRYVKEAYNKYNGVILRKEIEVIERKIRNFPSASLFSKLCDKYFQIGEYAKAESYANTSIKEYPDRSGPYLVLGRIYKSRGEVATALKMYEKATMLEKYNYDALMEYAGLLEQANELPKALSVYKSVLFFAPADNEATARIDDLTAKVGDQPAAPDTSGIAKHLTKSEENPFGDVDFEEKPASAAGTPAPPPPLPAAAGAPADRNASTESERLVDLLREFRDIQGVEGTIIVDNYGLIVAADIEDSFDVDLLAAVLTGMLRTITQHAEPADFGAFDNAFVESEKINFHLYSVQNVELVIFSNAQARLGLLEMKIKAFIEKYLEIEADL